jgi:hypothetical protein
MHGRHRQGQHAYDSIPGRLMIRSTLKRRQRPSRTHRIILVALDERAGVLAVDQLPPAPLIVRDVEGRFPGGAPREVGGRPQEVHHPVLHAPFVPVECQPRDLVSLALAGMGQAMAWDVMSKASSPKERQ